VALTKIEVAKNNLTTYKQAKDNTTSKVGRWDTTSIQRKQNKMDTN